MPRTKRTARSTFGVAANHNRKRKLDDANNTDDGPPSKRMKLNSLSTLSTEQVIYGLNSVFIDIEQPCDLSIGGRDNLLPLIPGLHINEIGEVPLPISQCQLQLLLSTASKSSFGHGTKTENNDEIRKSLELTSNQFSFKNNEWNKQIQRLIQLTAIKLGCDDNHIQYVKGYCYKLLIYEKDGHFVEHRDTQKIEGQFATLIVQLPSKYTMIDNKPVLMVKHRDNTFNYYFGTKTKDDMNEYGDCRYHIYYAAHYVDLTHKINKINNGIRMAVTYNLCWNGPKNMMPTISNIETITDDIDNILSKWTPSKPHPIAINLHHLYTDNELSKKGINALKGSDFAKIYSLMQSKSAEQMNLQIFIAGASRTIEEYDTSGDYRCGGCDWEESDRSTTIDDVWYSAKGKTFKFGKFMDINLEENCIGYDEDDEEWQEIDQTQEGYLGNEGATQTTTYSKYIAIFFKKANQFQLLLNNGIEGGVEWINYLLTKDKYHDITAEIKMIINKFNGNDDKSQVVPILKVLLKTNNFDLMGEFINNTLIPHGIGLHKKSISRYVGYGGYGWNMNAVNDKGMIAMISDVIVEYGWNDPIKSAVLNLMDCMNNNECGINNIYEYCSLLKTLRNKHYYHHKYEAIYNAIDQSVMIKKLHVTHAINKEIAEYALDNCFEEISDKLWRNIVNKLQLNDNGQIMRTLTPQNIVGILQFILSCNYDNNQQKLMLDTFNKTYDAANISQETQNRVLLQWIEYVKILQNNKKYDIMPEIGILMEKYKLKASNLNHIKLIPSIFKILIKTKNCNLIQQFIDDKLIAHNIGLHQINYNEYILDLLIEYGWKEPFKSTILKLLNCMNTSQCLPTQISHYCLLPKLIKNTFSINTQQIKEDDENEQDDDDDDDDDDIIILNANHNNKHNKNNKENINFNNMNIEHLNVCWKEIADEIWKNIMQKLQFNTDGQIMRELNVKNIISILEFIMLCDEIWDNEYKQKMYKLFDNIYSNNINHKTQQQIVSVIKLWSDKSLYKMECIQIVFRNRIRYLTQLKKPEFSWEMLHDEHISDKALEAFLKRNNKTFTKRGFSGIAAARSWARSWATAVCSNNTRYPSYGRYNKTANSYKSQCDDKYSIKCECRGCGRGSEVIVEKTDNYFNQRLRKYKMTINDLNVLLSLYMK